MEDLIRVGVPLMREDETGEDLTETDIDREPFQSGEDDDEEDKEEKEVDYYNNPWEN